MQDECVFKFSKEILILQDRCIDNNKLKKEVGREGKDETFPGKRIAGASMSREVAHWPISKEAGFYQCSHSQEIIRNQSDTHV